MTPEETRPEALRARLAVLERENELLAERAEEITLLGLVAELTGSRRDRPALLAGVLERVCILKGFTFAASLESAGSQLAPQAVYHALREDSGSPAPDHFSMAAWGPWPLERATVLAPAELARSFATFAVAAPGLQPTAVALVPFRLLFGQTWTLLFADSQRPPAELALHLPLLERVADLVRASLDNLALLDQLRRSNQDLGLDVIERNQELLRSEARYRTLFDHVPDGVLLVEASADGIGRVREANGAAAHMHGYSLEEMKRLNVEELTSPSPDRRLESLEERVWRLRPGEIVTEELLHRRKDGSTFPAEVIATLVLIQDQQYLLTFSRDISERKAAQANLLKTQRTESIGLLAGGVAHDFNNLLTAIMGQTGLAADCPGVSIEVRRHLDKAQAAAEKAALLTRQMLAYSGRAKVTLEPLDLNALIRENLMFLAASLPKQIRFELDLDPAIPLVTGDLGQLQQVIMNLVINGAEAIGAAEGVIALRTRGLRLETIDPACWPLGGRAIAPGSYLHLEVSDTGAGMSPEILARVFDPFFTTKEKGHGLGLSAVQGIIRSHHGGLAVDSQVGVGTTFRVLLAAGFQEAAQAVPAAGTTGAGSVLDVLAVDDEDYMLDFLRDSLESFGHRPILARSGEEALALFRPGAPRPDLVLLDLTMPGLGGLETFRRIHELAPDLPVVLSSGFAREEALAQLRELAPAAFLQKPYLPSDLRRVMERVGYGHPT